MNTPRAHRFPEGFLWGAATAAEPTLLTVTGKPTTTPGVKKSKAAGTLTLSHSRLSTHGRARVTVRVTAPAGLKPTGKVTVTIRKGSKTKAQRSATLKNGKAALTLPKLPRGTYKVTARYGGNANLVSRAAKSRTLRVVRN